MALDLQSERLRAILNSSPELVAYEAWRAGERAGEGGRDYLFAEPRVRFEPRREDRIVLAPGLSAEDDAAGAVLHVPSSGGVIRLAGVARPLAERILACVDGRRCLLEIRLRSRALPGEFARFLRGAFGTAVFAPDAVSELEAAVACAEVTRFPSSPYAVERSYWANMVDVRGRIEAASDPVRSDPNALLELARELHVLATLGGRLDSFYKPASPLSDRVVAPGALYLEEVRLRSSDEGLLYLDGPRVNATLVGGPVYHRLLYRSVGDPEAESDRALVIDGLPWGRVATALSEVDEAPKAWFFPPRPLRAEHLRALTDHLGAAQRAAARGEASEAVRAAARFHQSFVRLHPFHCANQSLAMAFVQPVLRDVRGAGIPHLLLDHFALRLTPRAYEEVFRRAVEAFCVPDPEPVRRLFALRSRNERAWAFIHRLAACSTTEEVDACLAGDEDAARWALLAT